MHPSLRFSLAAAGEFDRSSAENECWDFLTGPHQIAWSRAGLPAYVGS